MQSCILNIPDIRYGFTGYTKFEDYSAKGKHHPHTTLRHQAELRSCL
ncbi:MAG: hypothetical protein JW723_15430 [Bacteroidales bacterium]|nr:hypothetical protein [Bacteroidales bacterium]